MRPVRQKRPSSIVDMLVERATLKIAAAQVPERPALNARTIAQVAIFWHSSAQALQASPQVLHSVTLGKLSHSFLQSLQIISTVLARWPVCSELTAASVVSAAQAATS